MVALGLLVVMSATAVARAASPAIIVLTVKGVINPVMADYVARGIEQAEETRASLCVIRLDTPGGLDTAMRDIVQSIVNARVPVAVYVSPPGARAASAGVFVTVAAHVAAMAPGTAIGAASPVSIGSEGEVELSETMQEKVLNDAAAYIRSLAQAHGRNVEWAERAVREAVSASEREALELNVIDLVADSLDDLLAALNGYEVTLLDGPAVTIRTEGAFVRNIEMSWVEKFLLAITDPNIAFVLMGLATLGLWVEISNPGLIFPGVAGGICLILALYALGNLPVNIAGVLLVVGAFGLFLAEIFTPTFGLLTGGGIIALTLGSLILFKGGPLFQVNPWVIATLVIVVAAVMVLVIRKVVAVHRRQPATGREGMVGERAVVKTALAPRGTVLVEGELWDAVSTSGEVAAGEEVMIERVDGMTLYVKPAAGRTP